MGQINERETSIDVVGVKVATMWAYHAISKDQFANIDTELLPLSGLEDCDRSTGGGHICAKQRQD
jgi:hypothetical protein